MEQHATSQDKETSLRDTLLDITRERHDRLYRELKDLFEDYGSSVSQDTEFIVDQYMHIKKEKISLEDEIVQLRQENALLQTKVFEGSSSNAQESDSGSGTSVEVLDRELKKATVQLVQAMEEGERHRRSGLVLKQSHEESQRTAGALKAALERNSGVIKDLNKGMDELSNELRSQAVRADELEAKLQRAEALIQQQHSTLQELRTTETSLKGQLEATSTELKQSLDFIAEYMPVLVPLVVGKTKGQSLQQTQPTAAQQALQQASQQPPQRAPQQAHQQAPQQAHQQAQQQQLQSPRSNQQQPLETLLKEAAANQFNQVMSRAGLPLYPGAPLPPFAIAGAAVNNPIQHPHAAQQGMFPSPPASGQNLLQQAQPIPQPQPAALQQQHQLQLQQQLVMQHLQQKQQHQQQQQQRQKQHQYLLQQHQEQQQLQQQQQQQQHQHQQQQLQLQKMRIHHFHQQQQLQRHEEKQQQQQQQIHQQLQQRLSQQNALSSQLQQPQHTRQPQLSHPQQQSQGQGLTILTHSIPVNEQRPDMGARSASGQSTHGLSSIPRQEPVPQQLGSVQGHPVYLSSSSAPATPTVSTPVSQQPQVAIAQNLDWDNVEKLRQQWLLYHTESTSIVQLVQQLDSLDCTPEQRERQKQNLMERQKQLVNAMNSIRKRLIDMNDTNIQKPSEHQPIALPPTPSAIDLPKASSTTPVTPVFAIDLTDNTPATPTETQVESEPSSAKTLEDSTTVTSELGPVSTSTAVADLPSVLTCTAPETSTPPLSSAQTAEATPSSFGDDASLADLTTGSDSQLTEPCMVVKPAGDTLQLDVTSSMPADSSTTVPALGTTPEMNPVSDPAVSSASPREGSPPITTQHTKESEIGHHDIENPTDQSLDDNAMSLVQESDESLPANSGDRNLDQSEPISLPSPIPATKESESAQTNSEVAPSGTNTGNAKKRRLIIDWDDDDSDSELWDDVLLHGHQRINSNQAGAGSPRSVSTLYPVDQSRKRGKQDDTQSRVQESISAASTTPHATAQHENLQGSVQPESRESPRDQPADSSLSDQTKPAHKEDADNGTQEREQKLPPTPSALPSTTSTSSQPSSARTALAMPERTFFSTTRGDFKMSAIGAGRSKHLDGSALSAPWKNDIACLPSFKKRSSPVQIKVPRSFVTGNSAVAGLPVTAINPSDPVKRSDHATSNRPEANQVPPKRPTDPRLRTKSNSSSSTPPARSATQSPTATPQPTPKPVHENHQSSTTSPAVRPNNITRISFDSASQECFKSIFGGGSSRPFSSASRAAANESNPTPRPRHALPSRPAGGGAGSTPAAPMARRSLSP
ncbi:hypothetical protein BGZ72_002257 [Mortierella alpina]|nr:hypothetical protein BGZ72_002257 [Mortierella alpina]